jgi:hypothetical protein
MSHLSAKLSLFALLSALVIAPAAFADDTPAGVAADVGAVQKDNQALSKDDADLARHRAAKAQDKANNAWGSQAVDSVNIGADKAKRSEKESEKSTDKNILHHDVDNATSTQ